MPAVEQIERDGAVWHPTCSGGAIECPVHFQEPTLVRGFVDHAG